MAMPQRDELIDEIRKTDLLLEYAVQHGEEAEAERLRAKLRRLASMGDECKSLPNMGGFEMRTMTLDLRLREEQL